MTDNIKSKKACDELVVNNIKLAGSIAARFLGRGYDWEDLTQVGVIGLMKAAKNFDTNYGVKFSTYAVPVIMGEIKIFLRDDGIIKISRSLKEIAAKGKKYAEELRGFLGREPTVEEISEKSGIPAESLMEAFDANMPVNSINASERDGKECDTPVADKTFFEEKLLNKILVSEMLDSLDRRERQVIILRYFKEKTQSETAKTIGVSQVQISRIEKAVINKLRKEFSIQ